MQTPSLTEAVRRELLAHPDVTEGTHRFGGTAFFLGRYELGHLHGETVADVPLPPQLCAELVASGRIAPIEVVSESAWVSRCVARPEDVERVVELFRISYEYAVAHPLVAEQEAVAEPPQPPAPPAPRGLRARLRRR